jgi:hypothetical protein
MDGVAIVIVKDKHVVVSGTGGSEETARLVGVDLPGDPLVGNEDVVCVCNRVGVRRIEVGHSDGRGFRRERGTDRGKLGGAQVCALLVEVTFDHRGGAGWVLADLAGGKVWKSREMAGVEGLAPGRESRGEERGVNKSDAVGEGGGWNKSMGCSRGLGRGKIKVPEASVGGAGTREQQGGVAMNVKASGREGCRTAVIAQLTDGEERMGSKPRKNVGLAGGRGETREVQGGNVAGAEDRAVRDTDGEAGVGWLPVRVRAVDRNVVACAAGVGNGRGVGTRRGGDYRRVKTSNMI